MAAVPSSSAEVLFQLHTVRKVYRRGHTDVVALNDISLSVRTGEFVAIMGPSGSGKSTLMHLLGALDTPSEGTVRLHGQDLSELSRRELARVRAKEVGFVFQAFNLIPGLSALDNVALPAMLGGRGGVARARARELLERVGLADAAAASPTELSGGEQQRVAIARALVMDPLVLLADEPTGNLDSRSGSQVLSLLEGTRSEERTLVLVTHDPRIAARADRIVSLRDGQVSEELDNSGRTVPAATPRSKLLRVTEP